MDELALQRGITLAMPVAGGVVIGKVLFRPSLERFYKPFALCLLLSLALLSLIRSVLN